MGKLWSFIGQKKNREILAWICGGLAAVIVGLWTAFVYLSDKPKTTVNTPSVQADCGSVGVGGNVSSSTITAGSIGNCSELKP